MKKRILALTLALVMVFALASCAKKEAAGATITVTVVHKDGASKDFTVKTEKETLGEALTDEGLIAGEDSPYGLYVKTVDGETADEANQEWWCFTKGGESVNTGVDSTPVADGDAFEITFTVGYDQ